MTDSPQCRGSATPDGGRDPQNHFTELGLTASAGVAPVKFLAKIASDSNKPDGQYIITPEQVTDFVLSLPLRKIPRGGKVTAKRLADLGLETCGMCRIMIRYRC